MASRHQMYYVKKPKPQGEVECATPAEIRDSGNAKLLRDLETYKKQSLKKIDDARNSLGIVLTHAKQTGADDSDIVAAIEYMQMAIQRLK